MLFPIFLLFVFLFMVPQIFAEEDIFQNTETAFGDLSRVIETLFPKAEGRIQNREHEKVVVSFSKKNHLIPGLLLTVVRPEQPFYHPLTGEIMGYSEKKMGVVQVVEVQGLFVIGKVVEEQDTFQNGDQVRLTAGRLNLGIIKFSDWDKGLFSHKLARALEETGRFSVTEVSAGRELGEIDSENPNDFYLNSIKEIGERHPFHYAVLLDSYLIDQEVGVELQIYVVPWIYQIAKHSLKVRLSQEDFFILSEQPNVRPLFQPQGP